MSEITLYTTHCPQCMVLEKKLNNASINYTTEENLEKIEELGFLAAPILKVDDKYMIFKEACDWIKNIETGEC